MLPLYIQITMYLPIITRELSSFLSLPPYPLFRSPCLPFSEYWTMVCKLNMKARRSPWNVIIRGLHHQTKTHTEHNIWNRMCNLFMYIYIISEIISRRHCSTIFPHVILWWSGNRCGVFFIKLILWFSLPKASFAAIFLVTSFI